MDHQCHLLARFGCSTRSGLCPVGPRGLFAHCGLVRNRADVFERHEVRQPRPPFAKLKQIQGAERIDIGDKRVGEKYNEMQDINCPKCEVKMLRMADKTQFHIEYEFCPTCLSTFFDAGEFKDLNELTFGERFKKMVDIWLSVR